MCDDKIKVKLRQICQNPTRDLAICYMYDFVLCTHAPHVLYKKHQPPF